MAKRIVVREMISSPVLARAGGSVTDDIEEECEGSYRNVSIVTLSEIFMAHEPIAAGNQCNENPSVQQALPSHIKEMNQCTCKRITPVHPDCWCRHE